MARTIGLVFDEKPLPFTEEEPEESLEVEEEPEEKPKKKAAKRK